MLLKTFIESKPSETALVVQRAVNNALYGATADFRGDAVGHAWCVLLTRAEQRDVRAPLPWIYRVAFRAARHHARRAGQTAKRQTDYEMDAIEDPSSDPTEGWKMRLLHDLMTEEEALYLKIAQATEADAEHVGEQVAKALHVGRATAFRIRSSLRTLIIAIFGDEPEPPGGPGAKRRRARPAADVQAAPISGTTPSGAPRALLDLPALREPDPVETGWDRPFGELLALPALAEIDDDLSDGGCSDSDFREGIPNADEPLAWNLSVAPSATDDILVSGDYGWHHIIRFDDLYISFESLDIDLTLLPSTEASVPGKGDLRKRRRAPQFRGVNWGVRCALLVPWGQPREPNGVSSPEDFTWSTSRQSSSELCEARGSVSSLQNIFEAWWAVPGSASQPNNTDPLSCLRCERRRRTLQQRTVAVRTVDALRGFSRWNKSTRRSWKPDIRSCLENSPNSTGRRSSARRLSTPGEQGSQRLSREVRANHDGERRRLSPYALN